MDKVEAADKGKIVERCELFRKKFDKMLKAAQQGKHAEIIETKGKDIEKYQTKVKLYLGFIVDTQVNKKNQNKPGRIEEVSAKVEIIEEVKQRSPVKPKSPEKIVEKVQSPQKRSPSKDVIQKLSPVKE